MPYGLTFTDRDFYITTEPCELFAGELLKDIEEYLSSKGIPQLDRQIILHDAVYVFEDTYYPILTNSLLQNLAYYDYDYQFVNSRLKTDVISEITSYRIIDLRRKITVIQLDQVKNAIDLFAMNTIEEYRNWPIRELISIHNIISDIRDIIRI